MKRTLPTPPAHAPCTASSSARAPAPLKLSGKAAVPMAGAARDLRRAHEGTSISRAPSGGSNCGGGGGGGSGMVFQPRPKDAEVRQGTARGQLSQDIERELELVEQESAKLREQQARLDEEEREIDAKLRHLEMGMLRRKEALVRDREKRKMDFLREAGGHSRDCLSDGEARVGQAKSAGSGQHSERARTVPEEVSLGGHDGATRGSKTDDRLLLLQQQQQQQDSCVADAHYKAQSSCYTAEAMQCCKPYGEYSESSHRSTAHFQHVFSPVEFPTRDSKHDGYMTDSQGIIDSQSSSLLNKDDGSANKTPAMFIPMTSSPSDYHKHSYLSASDHALVPNNIGASRSESQELSDRFSVSPGCQSTQISSYQQYSHKQLQFHSQKPINGQMSSMEPKLLTNYEVIESHDPLMMSPTSTDSLGESVDMRLPLDDRGSIVGSPLSSISAESFYTDLDQQVPRNYVLIDDISELTGGGFLVDGMDVQNSDGAYSRSLPSATELNDFVGSSSQGRAHSRYNKKPDKANDFIAIPVATRAHPFRSLSDEASVDPLEKQMKRQMQQGFRRGSESLDHVVSPLMFDLNDNKYRNASRSDKYSMSRITLEKEAAKQLTPPYISSQSKSRKPDLDGRIFKFPSLDKSEDVEKDFLAYKNSSSKMESSVVLREKRLQGGDTSANFRQSIKSQQSFHGLPHMKTSDICIPRGIGSRPRSSSVSGLDGITSRMSGLYDLEYKRSRPCSVYNMEMNRSVSPTPYSVNRSRPTSVYGVDEARARPSSATDFNRSRSFSITGPSNGRAQPSLMPTPESSRLRPSSVYGAEEPKARPPPDCGITSSRSCSFSAYRSVMSRTRSSSFSGLDVRRSRPSTVYDLDFSASKQNCQGGGGQPGDGPCGPFNAGVKMRSKPSSLPISQGARRLSLTEQNSDEDESPLSPVVQPMGMARAAAGPLPPISADSREQFGSCHSLPEADRHAKDLHRRSLDCGFTRMVDNLNHALAENDVCYSRHGDAKKMDRSQDGGFQSSSGDHHQRQFPERLQKYDFPHSRIRLSQDSQERSVSGNGFGVRIVGGKEIPGTCGQTGAYIGSILQGGAAEKTGQLMEGMQVLEWNGMPLMGRTYEEVQHIVAQQDEDLELCVRLDLNMLLETKNMDSTEQVYSPSAEKQKCMGVDPQQLALELRKVAMREASDSNDEDIPTNPDSSSNSSLKREHSAYDRALHEPYTGISLNGRSTSKPDHDALNRAKLELLSTSQLLNSRPPPKNDQNSTGCADSGCSPKHSPSPGSASIPGQRPPRLADCQQSTVTSSGSCSSPKQSSESSGRAQTPVDTATVSRLSPVLQQTHLPQPSQIKGFYQGPELGAKAGQVSQSAQHPSGPYMVPCSPSRSNFSANQSTNRQASPPHGGFVPKHPYTAMPSHSSHHPSVIHHTDDRHPPQHLHNAPPTYCVDRATCAPMARCQPLQMHGGCAANSSSPKPIQSAAERGNPQAAHNASHPSSQSPRHGLVPPDKIAFQQMATTSSPACAVPRPVLPAHGRSVPQPPHGSSAAFCSSPKPAPPVPERNQSLQAHGGGAHALGPEVRQTHPAQQPQSPYRSVSAVPRPSHPPQDRNQAQGMHGAPPPYSTIPRPASPGLDRSQLQHVQPGSPGCSPAAKATRPVQRTQNAPPPYSAVPRPYPPALDGSQAHYSHGNPGAAGQTLACNQAGVVVRKQPQFLQTIVAPSGAVYAVGFPGAERYHAECHQVLPEMPHPCCAPMPPVHASNAVHSSVPPPPSSTAHSQATRNSGAAVEASLPPRAPTASAAAVTKKQQQDIKQPHETMPPASIAGEVEALEGQPKPELGEIQLQLRYEAEAGDLVVGVLCARGLTARNGSGSLDPFVKVYLLPGKGSEVKRKTKFVHKSLNPEWNQSVVYHGLSREELEKRTLEVAVWDYDRFATNHFLGEVNIALCKASNLDDTARWHRLQVQSDSGERRKRSSLPPEGKQPESKGQRRPNSSPDTQEWDVADRKDCHQTGSPHCGEQAKNLTKGGHSSQDHKADRKSKEEHGDQHKKGTMSPRSQCERTGQQCQAVSADKTNQHQPKGQPAGQAEHGTALQAGEHAQNTSAQRSHVANLPNKCTDRTGHQVTSGQQHAGETQPEPLPARHSQHRRAQASAGASSEQWPACGAPEPKRFGADEELRRPEKKARSKAGGEAEAKETGRQSAPPRSSRGGEGAGPSKAAQAGAVDACPHGDERCRGPCPATETDVWVRMRDNPQSLHAEATHLGKAMSPKAPFINENHRGRQSTPEAHPTCPRKPANAAGECSLHAGAPSATPPPSDAHQQAGTVSKAHSAHPQMMQPGRVMQPGLTIVSQQPERVLPFSHSHNGYHPCLNKQNIKAAFQPGYQHVDSSRPHSPCLQPSGRPPLPTPSPDHSRQPLYAHAVAHLPKDRHFADYQHAEPHHQQEHSTQGTCQKKTHIPRATAAGPPYPDAARQCAPPPPPPPPQASREETQPHRSGEHLASRSPSRHAAAEPAALPPAVAQPQPRESQPPPQNSVQQQQQQAQHQHQVHPQNQAQPQQQVNPDGVKPSVKRKPLLGVSAARKGELSLACWPSC
ncbi:uncharacterized protein LOC116952745 [Petromyzon marinus]|uniref:uncharacterized protein LOC116952745 n=1 Tax=Petromyzon marinus TaxID=7757 RepID=UPI003F72BE7B